MLSFRVIIVSSHLINTDDRIAAAVMSSVDIVKLTHINYWRGVKAALNFFNKYFIIARALKRCLDELALSRNVKVFSIFVPVFRSKVLLKIAKSKSVFFHLN